ncbi:metallophosphoesterase [Alkalicoccus chagannorensis]|uniref:metallophosphoesterase n=1 Tax=Alkalicoccus chagannorensis TaxID=427072 RepID=UPI00040A1AD4|nr:metallophosphoesterase [Alkalicoccus chagannorensis]
MEKFDVIGDVHGCRREMQELLRDLGYTFRDGHLLHEEGRKPVFIGDLTDRGPDSIGVLDDVTGWYAAGEALYVPGNHCDKLYRWMIGRPVKVNHGLETTVSGFQALQKEARKHLQDRFISMVKEAPLYLQLDRGRLIAAHAGIRHRDIGAAPEKVRSFVLYGDTTGQFTEDGFPIRRDWASLYPQGDEWIVYGHTPVRTPRFVGRTVNIDTGCVFGGSLTALRYPELTTLSVASAQPEVPEKFSFTD